MAWHFKHHSQMIGAKPQAFSPYSIQSSSVYLLPPEIKRYQSGVKLYANFPAKKRIPGQAFLCLSLVGYFFKPKRMHESSRKPWSEDTPPQHPPQQPQQQQQLSA
jgi:hypothetical protein